MKVDTTKVLSIEKSIYTSRTVLSTNISDIGINHTQINIGKSLYAS